MDKKSGNSESKEGITSAIDHFLRDLQEEKPETAVGPKTRANSR